MTKGQFNKLSNLGKSFTATANIVISNIVEPLLVIAFDGLALAVDHGVGGDDAIWLGVSFDNFIVMRVFCF